MDASLSYNCPDVLSAADPAPVLVLNQDATRPLLLIADHAGKGRAPSHERIGLG